MAKELRAQLILDITKAKASIQTLQKDFMALATLAKSDFKSLGSDIESGLKKASISAKGFNTELQNLKDKGSLLKMELSTLKLDPKVNVESLKNLNTQFINLKDQVAKLTFDPKVNLQQVQSEFNKLNTIIKSNAKIIGTDIESGAIVGAKNGRLGIEREFTKKGIGQLIKANIISELTMDAIKGIGIFIADNIGIAFANSLNFGTAFSSLKSVAGATNEELVRMKQSAIIFGRSGKASAIEATKGMEEIVKAGRNADQAIKELPDAFNLARAGGINLADAANFMSTSLNSFSKEGLNSSRAANIIAGAANASAIDVDELRLSMQQVGAVSAIAGLSFKDTATTIALFGNKGLKGSDAGTSLKTMLLNLIPSSKKASDLFDELGITVNGAGNKFFDATRKIKSMADIGKVLSDVTKNMTEEQKLSNFEMLFGSDAIRGASILASAGADEFNNLATNIEKIKVADVAADKMDNLSSKLEILKNRALTELQIQFEKIEPKLTDFIDSVIKITDNIPNLVQQLNDIKQPLIVASIFFLALGLAIFLTAAGITTVGGLLTALAAPFIFIGAVASSALFPIILGIAAVMAIGYLLYANWDLITKKALELYNFMVITFTNIGKSVLDSLKPVFSVLTFIGSIGVFFVSLAIAIGQSFFIIIKGIVDILIIIVETIYNIFKGPIDFIIYIAQFIGFVLTTIVNAFFWAFTLIYQFISYIISGWINLIMFILTPIIGFFKFILDGILFLFVFIFTSVYNFILDNLNNIYTGIKIGLALLIGVWTLTSNSILSLFTNAFNGLLIIMKFIIDVILVLAFKFYDNVKAPFEAIGKFIKDTFNIDLGKIGKDMFDNFLNSINNGWSKIKKVFEDIGNGIKDAFSKVQFPKLPSFSTGIRNFKGGNALIAEDGPEIVEYNGIRKLIPVPMMTYLPKGTNVYNNDETMAMLNKAGNYANSSVFNNVSNNTNKNTTSYNTDNSSQETKNFNNSLDLNLGFTY